MTKPEIAFGFIKLVLFQGNPDPVQHFSFFIIPEDDDGIENLRELYLYHDREQLRWSIPHDEWVTLSFEGKNWIGTRSIAVTEGDLPTGVFRAVLINKGGESSEREFIYDGNVHYEFPELGISDGFYTINSQWPSNRFICYDRSGNYYTTVELTSKSGNLADLRFASQVRSIALWAEDEANFCSALTNAVNIN